MSGQVPQGDERVGLATAKAGAETRLSAELARVGRPVEEGFDSDRELAL
jgi:hypothetical protein